MQFNKLGTCCQILDNNGKQYKDTIIGVVQQSALDKILAAGDYADHKVITTNPTLRDNYLTDQGIKFKQCHAKVLSKVKQNLNALYAQLQHVAKMPDTCKMFRISSNLLPMYDHVQYNTLYDETMITIVEKGLGRCKKLIDLHDIVVTCHPDQYNIINSDKEHVRINSLRTLEYHRYFMEQLTTANKSCINVHVTGKLDHCPEFDNDFEGVYDNLRQWLSIENDDTNQNAGLLATLEFCNKYKLKMVYDLHHDFCEHVGSYVADDDRIMASIINTWQEQTPIFHVSDTRDNVPIEERTPRKLSPHSNYITNPDVIKRAKELLTFASVEVEAKYKNLAVLDLFNEITNNTCTIN